MGTAEALDTPNQALNIIVEKVYKKSSCFVCAIRLRNIAEHAEFVSHGGQKFLAGSLAKQFRSVRCSCGPTHQLCDIHHQRRNGCRLLHRHYPKSFWHLENEDEGAVLFCFMWVHRWATVWHVSHGHELLPRHVDNPNWSVSEYRLMTGGRIVWPAKTEI